MGLIEAIAEGVKVFIDLMQLFPFYQCFADTRSCLNWRRRRDTTKKILLMFLHDRILLRVNQFA